MLYGTHSAVISNCGDKRRVGIVLIQISPAANMRLGYTVIFTGRQAGKSKPFYFQVMDRYVGDCAAQEIQSDGNVVVKNMAYIKLN